MGRGRLMGIIILTVVMMISGCGLKGPPTPPAEEAQLKKL
ncbi:MAG: lipoprotein [Nitrospinota bacterium]